MIRKSSLIIKSMKFFTEINDVERNKSSEKNYIL